ncbi:hypothetical protein A7Q01_06200 [Eikenella sp. NML96-A-049]|uniref:hypothetical protein n=1 Tax=unclassified Eikenella TaxID=2639367 RepID=UPI0007E1B3BF|nr:MULTISPECIES: hypothetical protein [unclassified Eikenella]OAM34294.1 hypothetical protein A7P97_03545 [Eikenella sp. NML070372]OAM39039.1 hypothetical protein A7Q01_06200 [Eikenella sp. NML96-A-049]VDH00703.1 Uncharacterised protein [Helicobacter pametensis]
MDKDLLEKIILVVFSTSLGWLISQLTGFAKTYFERKKIIKLLYEELSDIQKEVERILHYHARNLQLYGANKIGQYAMIGISNPIYTNYYKDTLLILNQNQRISFQMIHKLVHELLNKLSIEHEKAQDMYRRDGITSSIKIQGEEIGELSKAGYFNCLTLNWHINFHLINKIDPDLSLYSKTHADYLIFLETINEKIEELIASGKNIKTEDFEKIYHEYYFSSVKQA